MLKYRIIPTLLLKDGRMVKSRQFKDYRDVGNPVTAARIYDAQRADELIFLDISASQEQRKILFDIIREVSKECFMPLGVGGGIRSVEEIRILLKAGADKAVINTAAFESPELISQAAKIFGSSTIVVSIDVRLRPPLRPRRIRLGWTDLPLVGGGSIGKDQKNFVRQNFSDLQLNPTPLRGGKGGVESKQYEVFVRGGTVGTGIDPISWAKKVEALGAGEIFLTSIDRDGTMTGYDLGLIKSVADAVSIPVIASGGAGSLEDFKKGIEAGAMAVAGASIFHFTDQSPIKARKYLFDHGVVVRP